jgi:alkylation response protein AidB-like acyl-CoA dehydrogenase
MMSQLQNHPTAATNTANPWRERVAKFGPAIEAAGPAADRARQLSGDTMSALHEQGMFRLLLPRAAGGAEIALPEFFEVIEAIAKYDASVAWCVCQGNGCAMLGAYLAPSTNDAIWGQPNGVLAWGPGKAESIAVDGGYTVSADSMFVSGGHHATWLAAHCSVVRDTDGTQRIDKDGVAENRTIIFPATETTLTDTWDVTGLRGTGSDGFSIDGLFVPEEFTIVRATMIDALDNPPPLYTFPQMAIYAMGFAATALGIARGFLDAFVELAQVKKPRLVSNPLRDNPVIQDEYARAEARLMAARIFLVTESTKGWELALENALTVEQRMRIRLAATHAIHEAKAVVDILFDTAGTSSIFATSPFERRFRDIHMVAQQIQGRKTHYRSVGAWLLGHPPDMAVI